MASTSGLDDLVGEFPCIPFESSQLDILTTPDAFYNALEGGIKAAQRRVIIATLYFGTGQLEKRLVKAIGENPYRPKIVLLADLTRSTRSLKVTAEFAGILSEELNKCNSTTTQSSPLFLLRRIAHVPSARVALYQHHRLRGCLSRILPERLNETVGLQHMKLCVFDNNVIVSGANLSEEYFKTRQDRAWLFRDVQGLAEFYAGLVDVVASLSYHLTPEGELRAASKEVESLLGDRAAYCRLFRSRVEEFLAEAKLKYTAARAPTDCGSAVFPIVQMGAYGVRQEPPLVQRILRSLPLANFALTTGYFCPTRELEAAMIDLARRSPHPSPQIRVLCAAPEANSFFNSKGLSGNIPAAYREVLISFLRRIAPFPHIRVHEYFRPGWTFHAKGLWADMSGPAATLTLVGSSNFGYRSRDLDLESQVLVVARDEAVRRRIEAERSALWDARYLRPVTAAGLSRPPQPRLRWYARWMLPLLRRLM